MTKLSSEEKKLVILAFSFAKANISHLEEILGGHMDVENLENSMGELLEKLVTKRIFVGD